MTGGNLRRVGDTLTPMLLGGVGLWLILTALLDSASDCDERTSPPTVAAADTTSAGPTPLHSPPKLLTRPIESIRVGDRVLARNPDLSDDARRQNADPAWQVGSVARLELPLDHEPTRENHEPARKNHGPARKNHGPARQAHRSPPASDPDDRPVLHIELLRPDDWFRQRLSLLAVAHAGPSRAIHSPDPANRTPASDETLTSSATPLRP